MSPRHSGAALWLLLSLFGCTTFPVIEAGVCGNAIIEKGEDYDTFPELHRFLEAAYREAGTIEIDGSRTLHVWTPRIEFPGGAPRYTVSNCSPTTWKWQACVGPASTTQKRTRSPTFT